MRIKIKSIIFAILAAIFYAINILNYTLGANGFMDKLRDEFMKLPISKKSKK